MVGSTIEKPSLIKAKFRRSKFHLAPIAIDNVILNKVDGTGSILLKTPQGQEPKTTSTTDSHEILELKDCQHQGDI